MKKIQLKLGKEMLSKEQMKKVTGGSNCGDEYYYGGQPCPNGQYLYACGVAPDCYANVAYVCAAWDDMCCMHRCDVVRT